PKGAGIGGEVLGVDVGAQVDPAPPRRSHLRHGLQHLGPLVGIELDEHGRAGHDAVVARRDRQSSAGPSGLGGTLRARRAEALPGCGPTSRWLAPRCKARPRTGMAVSKPRRGAFLTGRIRGGDPDSTSHTATSVAPFQLACTRAEVLAPPSTDTVG